MTSKCKRLTFAAFLAVASCVVLSGSRRRATGPAEGGPIVPAGPTVCSTAPTHLRLASFNIHSGIGMDHHADLGRIADVLRGCDLAALQEVRGGCIWRKDQAAAIGDLLGERALFAASETRWWRPYFGNAVLTRTTIDHWHSEPLPRVEGSPNRNMVRLAVPFGPGVLNVLVTHLSHPRGRRDPEVEVLFDTFLRLPMPAVLIGDLNLRPREPSLVCLLATPGVDSPLGQRRRHDYILLRGAHYSGAGVAENQASDHPMVWVDLQAR
jgi:endonuclease/exonuclease/phosphatase family metal-dependent hydrolase